VTAHLRFADLAFGYAGRPVLDGITLELPPGSVAALIGPNGAGKTSTLRAISGLVSYKGAVVFDGVDCRKLNIEDLARAGLIHVPEGRHVFPSLDVHENLQLGAIAGTGRREGFSIDDVYDLFPPLQPLRKRDGWALSGGEQQMVAIGRGLMARPKLLMLDELSLGLAPKVVERLIEVTREINRDGTSLLLVEQDVLVALEAADRGYVLENGQVVLAGPAAELRADPGVRKAYLGI